MKVLTPWDVALRMMRNGRDPGLIVAYLEEEARRAGVDPLDLSMHAADVLARRVRAYREGFALLGRAVSRAASDIVAAFQPPVRRERQGDYVLVGPP